MEKQLQHTHTNAIRTSMHQRHTRANSNLRHTGPSQSCQYCFLLLRLDATLRSICESFSLLGPVVAGAAAALPAVCALAAAAAADCALINAAVRFEPDDGSAAAATVAAAGALVVA